MTKAMVGHVSKSLMVPLASFLPHIFVLIPNNFQLLPSTSIPAVFESKKVFCLFVSRALFFLYIYTHTCILLIYISQLTEKKSLHIIVCVLNFVLFCLFPVPFDRLARNPSQIFFEKRINTKNRIFLFCFP